MWILVIQLGLCKAFNQDHLTLIRMAGAHMTPETLNKNKSNAWSKNVVYHKSIPHKMC